jgi:hypothetical protein
MRLRDCRRSKRKPIEQQVATLLKGVNTERVQSTGVSQERDRKSPSITLRSRRENWMSM